MALVFLHSVNSLIYPLCLTHASTYTSPCHLFNLSSKNNTHIRGHRTKELNYTALNHCPMSQYWQKKKKLSFSRTMHFWHECSIFQRAITLPSAQRGQKATLHFRFSMWVNRRTMRDTHTLTFRSRRPLCPGSRRPCTGPGSSWRTPASCPWPSPTPCPRSSPNHLRIMRFVVWHFVCADCGNGRLAFACKFVCIQVERAKLCHGEWKFVRALFALLSCFIRIDCVEFFLLLFQLIRMGQNGRIRCCNDFQLQFEFLCWLWNKIMCDYLWPVYF